MNLFLKRTRKNTIPIFIFLTLLSCQKLKGGAFIELSGGYNVPIGEWGTVFGKGFFFGGMAGFTFSEFVNPGIGGFLSFPKTGEGIEDEYKTIHDTEYISLFTSTGFIYLTNRMNFALTEKNIFTVEVGYGIHSQRCYVTIIDDNYEARNNFSGHGPFIGFSLKRHIQFSVFDHIMPFVKIYYSPNKVSYHIVDANSSIVNLDVGDRRIGIYAGISLISIGEE